ncbi:hypothetical protein QBC46DRAFT_382487 [Diplogelasinospora grovesii]|uniref:Uncharacterized protein n=1 Tax=Diplogelasinospora grovesii TaxID=303347 RepID=A0AAN6S6E0_9PEZI|nr:hypothetical protein QBC46DRAFT_382487 [Diplogelasinospora grovesii]
MRRSTVQSCYWAVLWFEAPLSVSSPNDLLLVIFTYDTTASDKCNWRLNNLHESLSYPPEVPKSMISMATSFFNIMNSVLP